MMALRIGIMGGTFDPIHSGHLRISTETMRALALDRVMLLPAGDPPHKHATSMYERLEMCRLAALGQDGLFVSDAEVLRDGVTYTADTLSAFHRDRPDVDWYYIIGADTLAVLDSWRNLKLVSSLCTFAVCGRADADADQETMRRLARDYGARFFLTGVSGPDISSTEIRARRRAGEDISSLVPARVANHIRRRGLYLCDRSRDQILRALSETLKPARYAHTLGVAATARRLAPRCGVETGKADLAALLHDCAKSMRAEEMRALITASSIETDAAELAAESVLHAPAGMLLAQREFGVQDPEILSAIRCHTLGGDHMRALDELIYVSDFIEPGRADFPGLSEARRLAQTDLHLAARRCAELTAEYLRAQGLEPHPRTLALMQSSGTRPNKA